MKQLARTVEPRTELVQFGASFVKSEAFKELFREGMGLVEETANYLDGDGRDQSHRLGRTGSLAYASESMRLTTRLMQIASWLLVQRAVAEGEITPVQATREKDRVKLSAQSLTGNDAGVERLPERLRELIGLSLRLHARVVHLDSIMAASSGTTVAPLPASSPVAAQQMALRSAFGLAS